MGCSVKWVAQWNKQEYLKASKTLSLTASSLSSLALPQSLRSTITGWILVRTNHWSSTLSATWASWADTPHPSLNQKRAPACPFPPPTLAVPSTFPATPSSHRGCGSALLPTVLQSSLTPHFSATRHHSLPSLPLYSLSPPCQKITLQKLVCEGSIQLVLH